MPASNRVRTVPAESDPTTEFPRAIAARIGDRDLWLGNSGATDPDHLDRMGLSPAHVVSVNLRAGRATTDHHPLDDGRVNDQAQFRRAVETARERYRQSGPLLVNCAAGISRSTTVVGTVLATEEGVSFEAAVDEIRETRKRAAPHKKLQINAQSYLTRVHGRASARTALERLAEEVWLDNEDSRTPFAPIED